MTTDDTIDLSGFTSRQIAPLHRHYQARVASLSARARRLLRAPEPPIVRDVVQFIRYFDDWRHRRGYQFRQIGPRTLEEVLALRAELVQLARTIRTGEAEPGILTQTGEIWKTRFRLSDADVSRYRETFIAGDFPLFRFLHDLFDREGGFGRSDHRNIKS